jgi:hypothetical protein
MTNEITFLAAAAELTTIAKTAQEIAKELRQMAEERATELARAWQEGVVGDMPLELSEEETAALAELLTEPIEREHYPHSLRVRLFRSLLAKLREAPTAEPRPREQRSLAIKSRRR